MSGMGGRADGARVGWDGGTRRGHFREGELWAPRDQRWPASACEGVDPAFHQWARPAVVAACVMKEKECDLQPLGSPRQCPC